VVSPGAAVETMRELTNGLGADVVIEAVGLSETFEPCTEPVRAGGHVANVGVHGRAVTLHLEALWIKDITVTTGLVDTSGISTLLKLVETGHLTPHRFKTHRFLSRCGECKDDPMPIRCTPDEAVAFVRPTDTIGFGLGPANPHAFLQALGGRDDWEQLVLGGALLLDYYSVLTRPGVSYRSGFFGPAERLLLAEGHAVELVPGGFRQFAPILARFSPRIMCVQGAPPDTQGQVNLSLHFGATRPELLAAGSDSDRLLVVEINPRLPRTRSLGPQYDNTLPIDLIDVLVEADHELFALADPEPTDVDLAIATGALDYVSDGTTLQTGIGAVPNMVATQLATGGHHDLGVHSEMFTNGLMRLHVAGKVSNAAKGVFDGISVTTFALGSAELYQWLDENDLVAFLPVEVVNDPTIIGRNRRLVAIEGALSVDLYGQVVADNIGNRQISGVGGHEDFVAGADLSLEARSLVCLPSTVMVGGVRHSRIVGVLPEGSVVSTPRHHTGVVITEFGAAELTGLTVRERAHALSKIAHPDFREELRAAADSLGGR
jgi:acyl-CoA hydrolase